MIRNDKNLPVDGSNIQKREWYVKEKEADFLLSVFRPKKKAGNFTGLRKPELRLFSKISDEQFYVLLRTNAMNHRLNNE